MRKKYPSQSNEIVRAKNKSSRIKVLEYLGGECAICGFNDFRALQIDHVNGNGKEEKIRSGATYHKLVMDSYDRDENKYQILCANCNWIKRYDRWEVRNGKALSSSYSY